MKGRLITIGDIHGCHAEFNDLLAKLSPTSSDEVVLLGDLVNRGPDSRRVLATARSIGATSLLGNHEARLLNHRRTPRSPALKSADRATLRQLHEEDFAYLEAMKLHHHNAASDIVFVHGGFLPCHPWWMQPAEVVTRIQVIDRLGRPRKRAECPGGRLWCEAWQGPPFVVYGHIPERSVVRRPWSLGIDTGCVFGGWLTAYVLPVGQIVQVRARERYW